MSSGFVAAGSGGGGGGNGDEASANNNNNNNYTTNSQQDSAWAEAQRKIDATRQHSSLMGSKPRLGEQEGGKSLYETLQANKGEFYFSDLLSLLSLSLSHMFGRVEIAFSSLLSSFLLSLHCVTDGSG